MKLMTDKFVLILVSYLTPTSEVKFLLRDRLVYYGQVMELAWEALMEDTYSCLVRRTLKLSQISKSLQDNEIGNSRIIKSGSPPKREGGMIGPPRKEVSVSSL